MILLSALALAAAIVLFVVAWARGAFDVGPEAAMEPLDAEDLRLARPWETPTQAAERVARHGPPVAPAPGEWGGA
ncbi:MAG: hypothetical protein ACK4YP_17875 [Myxococcota bacterium]